MLQSRGGMPALGLLPDMTMPFPPIHPPQPGLIQTCIPSNSAEALRRPINLQSPSVCAGFKEPSSSQVSISSMSQVDFHSHLLLIEDFQLNSSASGIQLGG